MDVSFHSTDCVQFKTLAAVLKVKAALRLSSGSSGFESIARLSFLVLI